MKRLLPILLISAIAAPAATAAPAPAGPSTAWTARMTVPTHTPKARKRWPVKIVVKTASGRRLSGTVQYHFLFGGQVVATRDCHPGNHTAPCPFTRGVYRDVIHWPAAAIGHKLTFQAVVRTKLGTKKINWWVKVHR